MENLSEFKPRFEIKKFVTLPVEKDKSFDNVTFIVGRYVGTSFRKVVSFDSEQKALKFIRDYSGDGRCSSMVSDFVVYRVLLKVDFPADYDPKSAFEL